MQDIWNFGEMAVAVILGFAGLLKNPGAPGLIAMGFGLVLVIFLMSYWARMHRQIRALNWMSGIIGFPKQQGNFGDSLQSINGRIAKEASAKRSPRKTLANAWGEYTETIVEEKQGENLIARNSVRPAYFFNVEDLAFGQGFYRILPNLFVTFGLFFTFLGLIAVLKEMSGQVIDDATIQQLLSLASAKFIMSLSGLLASIAFSIALRILSGKVESATHKLCGAIEDRLSFISQEEISLKQLKAMSEQSENLREVGMEIATHLGDHINDSIEKNIPTAIATALEPILQDVGKMGAQGAQDAAAELSEQLSGGVKDALGEASRHLADAAGKIGGLADRLDNSSGRMGSQMEGAVERMTSAVEELRKSMASSVEDTGSALNDGAQNLLGVMNETLSGIRDNTSAGARAMSEAAGEMRSAATIFGEELRTATENGVRVTEEKFNAAGDNAADKITKAAQAAVDLANESRDEILQPLNGLVDSLEKMTEEIDTGARRMTHMSDSVKQGAEAVSVASHNFTGASEALVSATSPIVNSTRQVEHAATSLEQSARSVSETMVAAGQQTAISARDALTQATEILDSKRRGVADALDGVQRLVEQMNGQGDRLDDIDEKLGAAFETYNHKVEGALDSIKTYASDVQGKFNEGIDHLQAVVDQAEEFTPQSRMVS